MPDPSQKPSATVASLPGPGEAMRWLYEQDRGFQLETKDGGVRLSYQTDGLWVSRAALPFVISCLLVYMTTEQAP